MTRRWLTMSGFLGMGLMMLLAPAATGCGGEQPAGSGDAELGTLNLPLATHGPSGQKYRLRDAIFDISDPYNYDYGYGGAGDGGSSSSSRHYTLNSEDDPDADALSISVEQGYYVVQLQPGWRLEKVDGDSATDVEATLLSGDNQWIYVSPRSSSWAEYQFGIGGRELWLNGNLNVQVQVYEDPDQYYGGNPGQGGASDGSSAGAGGGG